MFPKLQNITARVVSEITLDFIVIGFIVSSLEQQVSKEKRGVLTISLFPRRSSSTGLHRLLNLQRK